MANSKTKDQHHGGNDQHVNYRSGKHTGFNKVWFDNLRATKSKWTKVSEQKITKRLRNDLQIESGIS